jgi:hypothetical protein
MGHAPLFHTLINQNVAVPFSASHFVTVTGHIFVAMPFSASHFVTVILVTTLIY